MGVDAAGVIADLRALNDAIEQVLARVEEAEAEVGHQPLESGTGGEVEPMARTSRGTAPTD